GRNVDALVNAGTAHLGVSANVDAFEKDRVLDQRKAVDSRVSANDRPLDVATGDDRAQADHAIQSHAAAGFGPLLGEDKLRWRIGRQVRADRPVIVVKVQL